MPRPRQHLPMTASRRSSSLIGCPGWVGSASSVRIHAVTRPRARPSAVATSSSGWPRERTGAAYPEGRAAGKRLGGIVLSIQATTAECR